MTGDNCQYWLDLENQELSSPYYPQHYLHDGNGCEWLITAPEGHIISLEYDHFNVSIKLYSKSKSSCSGIKVIKREVVTKKISTISAPIF